MVNKNVGKRIREYREKAGITQEQLAEAIGIAASSLSNIERGMCYPTLENFIKIANTVGVSSDLLLIEVIENARVAKTSELAEKLERVTPKKRQEVFAVIEAMLEHN